MSDKEYLFPSKFTPYYKEDFKHPDLTLQYLLNEMTKEEAQKLFKFRATKKIGVNLTEMFKTIILAASRVHWPESRGVREFWYNPIKPILYRVVNEEYITKMDGQEERTGKPSRVYDAFDGVLSHMVKSNIVTYEQLGIVDFRTMRELYEDETNTNCWSRVVLFVEKDSAYHHLLPLKKLLNITVLSGGGVSKTACAEVIIRELQPGAYKIFTVTDYDPWGFFISDEAAQKLDLMGWDVELIRVALNPDQLGTDTIIQAQKYPVKIDDWGKVWCPLYGLPGPLGDKRYGFEIEALSGLPTGPKRLRELVLDEILKHLDQDDRIFEMTESAWDDMPLGAGEYYLDDFTWRCWKDVSLPAPLDEYITQEVYDVRKETIETQKQEELAPWEAELEGIETQITLNEELKDNAVSENESKYDGLVEEVTEEYIEPLENEEWELQKLYIYPIRRQINEMKEEHVKPLEEQREYHENIIRDSYDQAISAHEAEKESIEESIEGVEDDYDTERSILDEMFENSRAIFAQSVIDWLSENKDYYYNTGLDEKDCSMGVIRGFLKEACEKGETARDILNTVENWDKDVPYTRITDDIWSSMDEIMEYVSAYLERCKEEN